MNNRGYTLIEVILTLGILSASLVGIIHAFVTIDRSRIIASQYTQALLLQEAKLHDIAQQKNPSRASSEGTFAPPFEQFQWKAVQGSETRYGFKDVHLTIFWVFQQQVKELNLSTYVRKKNEENK